MQLGKRFVLKMPLQGEKFGTKNIGVATAFVAHFMGKYKKYKADDDIDFWERIGLFRLINRGLKNEDEVSLLEMQNELSDLSPEEWEGLEVIARKEYYKALGEDERTGEIAYGLLRDLFDLLNVFHRMNRDRGMLT